MRLLLISMLVACGGSSDSAPTIDAGNDETVEPDICKSHCVSPTPVGSFEDCCDSVTCYHDPDTGKWEVTYCDPPAPTCAMCLTDELCVQKYNGTCGGGNIECVPKTVDCPDNACTQECQDAYCASPYQCEDRVPCGSEVTGSFTCYGP